MKYVLYILLGLLGLFFAYILLIIVSAAFVKKHEYEKDSRYYRFLLHSSTFIGMRLIGIKEHTNGLEKIPKDSRFLLVCNHRSKFDPILTWDILRDRDIAFISKPENFSVPVYGNLIRKCCFMGINREDPRLALTTLKKAAELMKRGEVSVGVYPEGTRNYGDELLPFHNGVFKSAQLAGVPIVVVAMRGTDDIRKKAPWKRSDVYFDVIEVLDANYVKNTRTTEIGERVRKDIESVMEKRKDT